MGKPSLIFFLFLFFALIPVQAQAVDLLPLVRCGGYGQPECTICHFFEMINRIVAFLMFRIVPAVAVLMLVIGGVMFFFAGAKPEVLAQAKNVITSVVIGLLIIFSAWIIVNTILTELGIVESPHLLRWYQIYCPT